MKREYLNTGKKIIAPFVILICIGCQAPRLKIVHNPRFTSYSNRHPPARSGYPKAIAGNVKWGTPAPVKISGFDYLLRFTPEGKKAGYVVVQNLQIRGVRRPGGMKPRPFYAVCLEYLRSPVNDVHVKFIAAEAMLFEERVGIVGYLKLPGNPPIIPRDANAVVLDQKYLDSLSKNERKKFSEDRLREASFLRWRHRYNYDGCNPDSPKTPCGEMHCLELLWRSIDKGKAGREKRKSWSGRGL